MPGTGEAGSSMVITLPRGSVLVLVTALTLMGLRTAKERTGSSADPLPCCEKNGSISPPAQVRFRKHHMNTVLQYHKLPAVWR